jgi:cation transport ATPase
MIREKVQAVAAAITDQQRKNPLVFESDGSFNPSWLIIAILLLIATALCILAGVISLLTKDPLPIEIALAFLGATINIFLIAASSQNKAKMKALAEARSPGAIAAAIASVVRGGGGNTAEVDIDAVHTG